jgi:hypothetical protein
VKDFHFTSLHHRIEPLVIVYNLARIRYISIKIGIRKVLGASIAEIVRLLSKEFFWLVLIANVLAWPTA